MFSIYEMSPEKFDKSVGKKFWERDGSFCNKPVACRSSRDSLHFEPSGRQLLA